MYYTVLHPVLKFLEELLSNIFSQLLSLLPDVMFVPISFIDVLYV